MKKLRVTHASDHEAQHCDFSAYLACATLHADQDGGLVAAQLGRKELEARETVLVLGDGGAP